MTLKPFFWPLAFCMSFTLLNCGDDDGDDGGENPMDSEGVTFEQVNDSVFAQRCATAGCHVGNSPAGGMSLEVDKLATQVIGVDSGQKPELKRVDPQNPEGSYLLKKIRGDEDIEQRRMPLGGNPLSAAQIALVRDWIADGAPIPTQ